MKRIKKKSNLQDRNILYFNGEKKVENDSISMNFNLSVYLLFDLHKLLFN